MQFLDKLTEGGGDSLPPLVENRVCQADADIFAYECCDYNEPLADNIKVLDIYIEQQRLLAGAGSIVLHLTMGQKAGRYEAATVKEYQANRSNRDPLQQERVWELRRYMESLPNAQAWYDREADDGMAQYQIARIREHGVESSIIMTMDKDLRMVPGLHIHPVKLDIHTAPDGYGVCTLDESTSTKKVVGWGTSFFWHQMLMGDTADNIPGLPKLTGTLANRYKPTKKFNPTRNAIPCGPATAYLVLEGVTSDSQALSRVLECYQDYYGAHKTMYHWDGSEFIGSYAEMFFEQAKLLWMQRVENEDFKVFLQEIKDTDR